MQTLAKAALSSGTMGAPLPDVYNIWAQPDVKVRFRRGATSMIAGPPGSFKSTLALNLACQWALKGLTGFYVSADSDQFTVAKRCASLLSGDPMEYVEKRLRKGKYTETLNKLADVRWKFRPLTMTQLDFELRVFEATYGHLPDFIFMDNLMNMVDNPTDFAGQATMMRDLDVLARDVKTHICILHHTSEQYKGTTPPGRWDIQNKVTQMPRLVLTVNVMGDRMMVAPVKNTLGPQQADGQWYHDFLVQTENCRIVEVPGQI